MSMKAYITKQQENKFKTGSLKRTLPKQNISLKIFNMVVSILSKSINQILNQSKIVLQEEETKMKEVFKEIEELNL